MKGKRVLIVGGGVAGLSAAHELVERGFAVTLHERRAPGCRHDGHEAEAFGGKARSYRVGKDPELRKASEPGRLTRGRHGQTAQHAYSNSPGEHGFRFFPAFYRHLPETMARIPSLDPKVSVAEHLVTPGLDQFATYRARDLIPFLSDFPHGQNIGALDRLRVGTRALGLTPDDVLFYFSRLWQVLTSCKERRFQELEHQSWYNFVGADLRSAAFRDYFGVGSTRNLVASRARDANARVIAEVSIQTWMPILFPRPWNFADAGDRILNGPTQDVWMKPWLAYLGRRGVELVSGSELDHVEVTDGSVTSLTFGGKRTDAFDYVILALPVERMIKLLTAAMTKADPGLARIEKLRDHLGWMSGIQFFLNEVPARYTDLRGHVNFVDSPWALTSILQSESWEPKYRDELRQQKIGAVLSVCVSDWKTEGFNGLPAQACDPDGVAREVWTQIVRALPDLGDYDRRVIGYALDEEVSAQWVQNKDALQNAEPLLVNKVDSWASRPDAGTKIRNLMLAGDYVRTNTGLACMEGANESARAAVNEILLRSGSREDLCQVWELPEPAFARAAQLRDRARLARGEAWQDVPGSPMSLIVDGGQHVANLIENLRNRA